MGQEEQPFAARRAIKLNRQAWPAYLSAPLIIIRMYPRIRRDLSPLRELDHVNRRRVSPCPA
jgi:hypothetical protein